jgi:hypothetical protein
MRRTLLICLLTAALLPAAALAGPAVAGEGTLSVRNGDGRLALIGFRGAIIGRVGVGRLTIVEPRTGTCDTQLVWAADTVRATILPGGELGEGRFACVYTGANMRFRLVGAQDEVRLRGRDIGASIVGRGTAIVEGDGGLFDGLYSLNGEDYRSLPDEATRLVLGPAVP